MDESNGPDEFVMVKSDGPEEEFVMVKSDGLDEFVMVNSDVPMDWLSGAKKETNGVWTTEVPHHFPEIQQRPTGNA